MRAACGPEDLVTVDGNALLSPASPAGPVRVDFRTVFPNQISRRGVERLNDVVGIRQVHDPVVHKRRRLLRAPVSSMAHDHASWSWPTLPRSISSSGLYPHALSVRLQLSQSPGAGLRSVSSVTGRKSVTCAGRPGLPSNTTIESGTRDRRIIGCSSHSTVQPGTGHCSWDHGPLRLMPMKFRLKIVRVAATPQANPGSHPRRSAA